MYGAGNVVAGKYRIERLLGQGGMGYVVAATHLDLGTPVALKFLHEHMLENQSLVDRFKREARSSAQLRGENICRVSDVGTAENGQPYIVMELLSGQDLTSVLKERGALPVPMVAEIVQQVCLALGESHALGIVHRDLKPGNLMMTLRPDGTMCIKVLDFGVAKGPEDINFSLTQTASVIGSPGYMSPEQLKSSKTADVRSDIWSLGIVMYELVSGVKPFKGESITELALQVAMDPMPPLNGVVPWYFEQVITRCLEKEAARRFADVADLAVALAPFAGTRGHEMAHGVARVLRGAHTPLPVPPSVMPASQAPAPAPVQPPSNPTTLRGASGMMSGPPTVTVRHNWKLPVILGGGAVLGVGLALLLVGGHKHEKPAASAESHAMSSPTPPATPTPTPTPVQVPATPTPTPVAPAQDEAAKANEEAAAKEQAAAKDEAAKAAAAKKEQELAKKEAAKQAAATAAAEKAEAAKAEAAKKQAAREASAKAAAEKKEQELAKKQAAREAAAKAAAAKAEAKAEAKKTSSASKTTKTTKASTQPKDLGDSRF